MVLMTCFSTCSLTADLRGDLFSLRALSSLFPAFRSTSGARLTFGFLLDLKTSSGARAVILRLPVDLLWDEGDPADLTWGGCDQPWGRKRRRGAGSVLDSFLLTSDDLLLARGDFLGLQLTSPGAAVVGVDSSWRRVAVAGDDPCLRGGRRM